jgi:hypothetical protein
MRGSVPAYNSAATARTSWRNRTRRCRRRAVGSGTVDTPLPVPSRQAAFQSLRRAGHGEPSASVSCPPVRSPAGPCDLGMQRLEGVREPTWVMLRPSDHEMDARQLSAPALWQVCQLPGLFEYGSRRFVALALVGEGSAGSAAIWASMDRWAPRTSEGRSAEVWKATSQARRSPISHTSRGSASARRAASGTCGQML